MKHSLNTFDSVDSLFFELCAYSAFEKLTSHPNINKMKRRRKAPVDVERVSSSFKIMLFFFRAVDQVNQILKRSRSLHSCADHPKLNAYDAKLEPSVAERFVSKGLTSRAVSHIERVVQPQAVMATTRPYTQKPCLAVDIKVVEAAVWKRLEPNSRCRIYRSWCRSPRSRWRGKRRAARQMCRVGRRRQRKRCQC